MVDSGDSRELDLPQDRFPQRVREGVVNLVRRIHLEQHSVSKLVVAHHETDEGEVLDLPRSAMHQRSSSLSDL